MSPAPAHATTVYLIRRLYPGGSLARYLATYEEAVIALSEPPGQTVLAIFQLTPAQVDATAGLRWEMDAVSASMTEHGRPAGDLTPAFFDAYHEFERVQARLQEVFDVLGF